MAKKEDFLQVPVVENESEAPQSPSVVGELHIRVYDNGGLELFVPDTSRQMSPDEIEGLTQLVHKQLYEQRIARIALDMFKQRLGG